MNLLKHKTLISGVLILAAVGLLFPIYNAATWWVSLEAPQYPEEAFPDGVKILFHLNGVFSGCQLRENAEILAEEALDCVHEMDTINHYVGMYPIAAGGPVELFFSIFLLSLVGIMLVAFIIERPAVRTVVMGLGFIALAIWMGLSWFGQDGIEYHHDSYIEGRISVLGEEVEDEPSQPLTAAEALIAKLKASLAESDPAPEAPVEALSEKERNIAYLRDTFINDQRARGSDEEAWTGSGRQLLAWHYGKSLGRYFGDDAVLAPMVSKMSRAGDVLFWAVLAIMGLLLVFARKPRGPFNWLLIGAPMALPLLFVIEYAAWLWWYGHNMNSMGAFTLKPFMPTVFGQGKVAQFTTNSYPTFGFWLLLLFSLLLGLAIYLRTRTGEDESAT